MKPAVKKPSNVSGRKSRIPKFASVQEEADFWDSHSVADYEDEFEQVDDVIFVRHQPSKKGMTVRLEPDILTLLADDARDQGIGPSTLARMVIIKYLKDSGRGTAIRRPPVTKRRRTAAPARKRAKGAA